MKSLFFIFPFLFTIATSIEFNFNQLNLDKYTLSPYRVLGIPPWSTDNTIKKKYKTLVKKLHPDKNPSPNAKEQFRMLHKAYEEIKKTRKLESSNESGNSNLKGFNSFLTETFFEIIKTQSLFNLIYGLCWLIYKFNQFMVKPMIFGIIAFNLIDTLFPHIIQSHTAVIAVSVLLSILLHFLTKSNKSKLKEKVD